MSNSMVVLTYHKKNEDFREAKNRAFLLSHMKIIETIFFVVLSSHDKVDRIFCYVPAISTLYPLELSLSHLIVCPFLTAVVINL